MKKIKIVYKIDGQEVEKILDTFPTKIYQNIQNPDICYITSYDDVVATIQANDNNPLQIVYNK